MPLYASASRSSWIVSESTPSASIMTSSALMAFMRCSSRYLRKASDPKGVMSRSLHRFTSCARPTVSSVISSVKSFENLTMSSLVHDGSPSRTRRMKCTNSSAVTLFLSFLRISRAMCSTVLCRNLATSMRARSCFFISSSTFHSCLNVDGSMPGKSQSATGSANSMKGTMMKTENGIALRISLDVCRSCISSRRVSSSPSSTCRRILNDSRTSLPSSLVPTQ
mmetsp:Transcript_8672/g.21698  ORF Transcript_8672/g.21698 Transcript_8672/m.21698 type:complete len:223 (+) Transcript_8672:1696-2364(+)